MLRWFRLRAVAGVAPATPEIRAPSVPPWAEAWENGLMGLRLAYTWGMSERMPDQPIRKEMADRIRELADQVEEGRFLWTLHYSGRESGTYTLELVPFIAECPIYVDGVSVG